MHGEEQTANTFINCATSALGLGKNRYALNEFQHAEESGHLGKDSSTLVAERLAVVHSCLGNPGNSEEYAKRALQRLEESPSRRFEPYIYQLQGFLCFRSGKQRDAIPWFRKAYDSFRDNGLVRDSANTLISLADCYYESGNLLAARRTLDAAKGVCESYSLIRVKALALTLTGLIDEDSGRFKSAEANLKEADEIAKGLNDRILRFQVEFYLLKHAVAQGKTAVARAIRRRLSKLALSVPASVEQLLDFRSMEKNLPPT